MRPYLLALLACPLLGAAPAAAASHASWEAYMKANRYKCPGPLDTLKPARTLTLAGKKYLHSGYRLEVQGRDDDDTVAIGVVSAIKDVSPGTKANLASAMKWFQESGVEWVIANGDLALEEFDLEEVIDLLGRSPLPVVIVLGNSESRGSWARAYGDRAAKYPNLINGTWVRQIVADDVELWTLPGYHDKTFVRQGAGCAYDAADIDLMATQIKPEGSAPVVLISHGPPLGTGKDAIDYILDKKNVGDPQINRLLEKASVPFGLFGHILEAGGRAVAKDMKTPVPQGKMVSELYLNAGSLSGDPWAMNDGTTSWGMAVLVTISGKNARYEVKRFPRTP